MFCTTCGKQVEDGAAFCDGCGAALSSPAPVAPPANNVADLEVTVAVSHAPTAPQAPAPVPVAPVVPAPMESAPMPSFPVNDSLERTVAIPHAPTPQVSIPAPMAAPAPMASAFPQEPPAPAEKKKRKGLLIAIVILIIVGLLGGTGWFLYDNGTLDDWFGSSSTASKEDASSATGSNAGSNPASTPVGGGQTTSTPTTSTPVESAPVIDTSYNDGTLTDGVYVNYWANLKYNTNNIPDSVALKSDAELAAKIGLNIDYGFVVSDPYGQNLQVMFEDLQGQTVTDQQYLADLCDSLLLPFAKAGYSATIGAQTIVTVNGVEYRSAVIYGKVAQTIALVQQILVRQQDGHMIGIVVSAQNEQIATQMVSLFEPAL